MDKPNLEATLYSHMELVGAFLRSFETQCLETIFNNEDILELVRNLNIGMMALQLELDRAYEDYNEPSVCY